MKPTLTEEAVSPLFDSKYIKVFDLQYEKDSHYYNATRRDVQNLAALKSDEAFRNMLPDAVTCIVVLNPDSDAPRLLLSKEFRYPAGRFLLSPPAGLLDTTDTLLPNPVLSAAAREIREETGLQIGKEDTLSMINPLLFSSPGMTDESNALVYAGIHVMDTSILSQKGAIGGECFDGFCLLTKEEALAVLKTGTDADGIFYSVYTWAALLYFVSDLWKL